MKVLIVDDQRSIRVVVSAIVKSLGHDVIEAESGEAAIGIVSQSKVDLILIMSVNPGFGGQSFIPESLHKISEARKLIDVHQANIRIAVDGGVKPDNIGQIAAAGADTFIAGSAVFGSDDYATTISSMRKAIADHARS